MAGEAPAHVQGFGLKAGAAVSLRLVNSPVTRGHPPPPPLVTASLEEREFDCMHDYDFWNFWAHLLVTFQSTPDWFKTLWLLIPPGFLLALIALLTRFRIVSRRAT